MNKIITTSWDDGHPLDLRVAELLEKYGLKATFYIPEKNPQNLVMQEEQVALLSKSFEIGGHTLNHVNLSGLSDTALKQEIYGSYQWLYEVTGKPPVSFCPPFGAYDTAVLKTIKEAGFKTVRTTQLLSTAVNPVVNHTTMQLYHHSAYTYAKHLLIRGRIADLKIWLGGAASASLLKLTDHYLDLVDQHGGCFHLWGHSWEIEKYNLWGILESVLMHIANHPGFIYAENAALPAYHSLD